MIMFLWIFYVLHLDNFNSSLPYFVLMCTVSIDYTHSDCVRKLRLFKWLFNIRLCLGFSARVSRQPVFGPKKENLKLTIANRHH